jgi:hypothetical protein
LGDFPVVRLRQKANSYIQLVLLGTSSSDIRLKVSFALGENLMVKKESVSLVPKEKVNELKPNK